MQLSTEEIKRKAGAFQSRITKRNWGEYLAAFVVMITFAFLFGRTRDVLARVAFGLEIAGTVYVMWQLWTRGSGGTLPEHLGRASCLEFYGGQLRKQRDLLANVWRWYLGPFVPGLALFLGLTIYYAPAGRRWFPVLTALFTAAVFWWIGDLNQRAAWRLDRQIQSIQNAQAERA